jgi:hypothetical protein
MKHRITTTHTLDVEVKSWLEYNAQKYHINRSDIVNAIIKEYGQKYLNELLNIKVEPCASNAQKNK